MNERDFASAPILKLFFRCTVPAMVGMGFSAIYNITDGIFVGHFIGQEALAAVNLVMPIIMIITALADMVAAAILSLLAMMFLLTAGRLILPLFIKDGDAALFDMSWRAMRFFALSYLVSWIEMTLSGYLTALEKPLQSLLLSLLGTLIFPLLFLAILVPILGLDGVWLMSAAAGTFSAIAAIIIVKKVQI